MAMSLAILGSGSAGNCTLLSLNGRGRCDHVLLDAGLSPRETTRRLAPLGLTLDDISEMLITHADHDHLNMGWSRGIEKYDIRLRLHRRHVREAGRVEPPMERVETFDEGLELPGGARVEVTLLAHDDVGSAGFVIEHHGARLGFATDLGRVPESLFDRFTDLDALAIESNYDREMQVTSNRPAFLKRRIMGGMGHLSNDQSFDAVTRIAGESRLQHIALLHLSRQCNDPRIISRLYAERARPLLDRLTISHQYEPTPLLRVEPRSDLRPARRARPGEQIALF